MTTLSTYPLISKDLQTSLENPGISREKFYNSSDLRDVIDRCQYVVCQIQTQDSGNVFLHQGSGCLIGGRLLITSNHVLPTKESALKSRAVFCKSMGQEGYLESSPFIRDSSTFSFDPDECFISSPSNISKNEKGEVTKNLIGHENVLPVDEKHLDFTIVALERSPYFDMIQEKVFSIFNEITLQTQVPIRIDEQSKIVNFYMPSSGGFQWTIGSVEITEKCSLYYDVKTEQESSGSPVMDVKGNFVALHEGEWKRKDADIELKVGVLLARIVAHLEENGQKEAISRHIERYLANGAFQGKTEGVSGSGFFLAISDKGNKRGAREYALLEEKVASDGKRNEQRNLDQALCRAIKAFSDREDEIEKICVLLGQHADPNVTDDQGDPILFSVVEKRNPILFIHFLEAGAQWSVFSIKTGLSPLEYACKLGLTSIMEAFFQWVQKTNEPFLVDRQRLLNIACYNGKREAVKLLLENDADVNKLEETTAMTPLMAACAGGSLAVVRFLVEERGASLKRMGRNKKPLEIALQFNRQEVIEFLQEKRRKPQSATEEGGLLYSLLKRAFPGMQDKAERKWGYDNADLLPESIEEIKAFLEKKKVVTEELLNCAVLYGSAEIVEIILERQIVPSRLTLHLARFIGNKKVLDLLDEACHFVREENQEFEKQEFKNFAKHIAKATEWDLTNHPEIKDEYFALGSVFSLKNLNLSGCIQITDKGLEQIAKYFPNLQELNLNLFRHREDLKILAAQAGKLTFSHWERKQGEITRQGIGYLVRKCKNLRKLSLASRYFLADEVGDYLADPSCFPLLESLDISDCYAIKLKTAKKIESARPKLKLAYDRLFAAFTVPQFLKEIGGNPFESDDLQGLQCAIGGENVQMEMALEILRGNKVANEQHQIDFQPLSLQDLLKLAIDKEADFLIVWGILKKGKKVEEDTLKYAIEHSKDYKTVAVLLDAYTSSLTSEIMEFVIDRVKDGEIMTLFLKRFFSPSEIFLNKLIRRTFNNYIGVQTVISRGASPTDTTLDIAIKYNHLRIIQLLIRCGLHPTEESLNCAVKYNSCSSVEYLLEAGVQPTEETMLEALKRGSVKVIELLLKYRIPYSEHMCQKMRQCLKNPSLKDFSLSGMEDISSYEDKKAIILYGSLESVRCLIDNEENISEDLLNMAVQRDSHVVVKMLLDKGVCPSLITCKISEFKRSFRILKMLESCISQQVSSSSLSEDKMFEQLVPFWKNITDLNLEGWDKLTEASFHPSNNMQVKLSDITSLQLIGCSSLRNRALDYISSNFPKLESLDISSQTVSHAGIPVVKKIGPFCYSEMDSLKKLNELRYLFLRHRHDIAEAVKNILINPGCLLKLKLIDLSDCDEALIQDIKEKRPGLKIIY